ncbi:Laminin subunit alpha-1 [Eufriesea mexicana]|uniref:Laminin subunit alpha-1 n=1 Tax=Eufriesea mexicana TaxID=516756 RepID=A0A310SR76_9HYME|nr:Laminin subunit alpha-1 [Eufriesea mexicana]
MKLLVSTRGPCWAVAGQDRHFASQPHGVELNHPCGLTVDGTSPSASMCPSPSRVRLRQRTAPSRSEDALIRGGHPGTRCRTRLTVTGNECRRRVVRMTYEAFTYRVHERMLRRLIVQQMYGSNGASAGLPVGMTTLKGTTGTLGALGTYGSALGSRVTGATTLPRPGNWLRPAGLRHRHSAVRARLYCQANDGNILEEFQKLEKAVSFLYSVIYILELPLRAIEHGQSSLYGVNKSLKNSGLFPSTFNVAAKADIFVNATCGEEGPETFCKPSESSRCAVCDARSPDPGKRHNISNILDSSPGKWWQSPSLARGDQYEYVTIVLDLKQANHNRPAKSKVPFFQSHYSCQSIEPNPCASTTNARRDNAEVYVHTTHAD